MPMVIVKASVYLMLLPGRTARGLLHRRGGADATVAAAPLSLSL